MEGYQTSRERRQRAGQIQPSTANASIDRNDAQRRLLRRSSTRGRHYACPVGKPCFRAARRQPAESAGKASASGRSSHSSRVLLRSMKRAGAAAAFVHTRTWPARVVLLGQHFFSGSIGFKRWRGSPSRAVKGGHGEKGSRLLPLPASVKSPARRPLQLRYAHTLTMPRTLGQRR